MKKEFKNIEIEIIDIGEDVVLQTSNELDFDDFIQQ